MIGNGGEAVELEERSFVDAGEAPRADDPRSETRLRTEVVRTLSHDLKTPLNAIRLNAELIGELAADSAQIPAIVVRILSIVDRMNRLISGLLDADRLNEGQRLPMEPRVVSAATMASDACVLFELAALQKKIRLECAVADDCPPVYADEDRILQVLWNLIGNAVKLTPPAGRVRLRVEPDGAAVRFSVKDAGPGIRDEDVARLFDPYWQEKRTARLGTGLGLPTSKAIVEAHGGRIWFETRRGHGSTFHFTVPVAASEG